MVTITQQAAAVLVEDRRSAGAPESYGVRLFGAIPPGGGVRRFALDFVPEAEPGDEVTEQQGVTAFLAPEVTEVLDEAVLDASPTESGAELVIRR